MNEGQKFCDKCGQSSEAVGPPMHVVYVSEKSDGLAAVLSLLWAGVGQIYVGRIMRGLGIMGLCVLLFVVGLIFLIVTGTIAVIFIMSIVYLIVCIWNVFDAYNLARVYNDSTRATGKRPW
ncbi:MAG: hypothetical protein FWD37_06725 [Methanomassiliicoccaceae archaeon]|nr:hypothetical protein [Methanomassiliicoccaceae archaeon]